MIPALTFAAFAVTLDGKPVLPRAQAAVADGRVLLPVRALGTALGARVSYDGRARTIVVQRGERVATIPAGGAVRIVRGTAFAPLRTVASAFGLGVTYDGRSRTVALADPRPPELTRPVGTVPVTAPSTPARTITMSETPRRDTEIHEAYPAISTRFAGVSALDPSSLRVMLDGNDVTGDAALVGDQVLYTPRRALTPGTHSVTIVARDAATRSTLTNTWSFVDTFAFSAAPPPTPFPVGAIWIDRWITPGTNAFDVYVRGAPGLSGYVGIDGVGGYFPLRVESANGYVAHVVVPDGVNQPFARVAARITMPDGSVQTIVLPQRINLVTPPIGAVPPRTPSPAPTAQSKPRRPMGEPSPTPAATPSPKPTAPPEVRRPVIRRPTPSPSPSPPEAGVRGV